MANLLLAWQNRGDEAALSGGSWLAALPLSNLQRRQVQRVARSTNATLASTQFLVSLPAARTIGVAALVAHNLSASAKVRFSASDTAGFSVTQYTSGWLDAWPSGTIPESLLAWEDDNFWRGTLSDAGRAGYLSPVIHALATEQSWRYWKVEVDDTTNADGYVQIGRLFLARAWRPTVNYAYGAGLRYEDPSPIETSLSGAEWFDQRGKFRTFEFELQGITSTEVYANALELQRVAGTTGEVLVVPDTDDPGTSAVRSFVGRLRQIGAIQQIQPTAHSARFQVKEFI